MRLYAHSSKCSGCRACLVACSLNLFQESNPKKAALRIEALFPDPGKYRPYVCIQCGKCADVCPAGTLIYEEGKFPHIDRQRCTGCGICSSVCSYKALVLYGKPMNAEEIFDAVNRDKMFYEASGGGVTVSGGEALLQPQLVCELFQKCRRAGIHTCIETSGYAPKSALRRVLPYTDYILFDLKHMNSDKHRQYTGKPNSFTLTNASMATASGVETLFRMPLIPGVNDDIQNIKETANFLHGLGSNVTRIELMPYHRLGKGKYESLDRPYHLPDVISPGPEHLESVIKAFESNGITCLISK